MSTIYQQRGYENRKEYLVALADQYGMHEDYVFELAELLGPNEDFDGLVTTLQDFCE